MGKVTLWFEVGGALADRVLAVDTSTDADFEANLETLLDFYEDAMADFHGGTFFDQEAAPLMLPAGETYEPVAGAPTHVCVNDSAPKPTYEPVRGTEEESPRFFGNDENRFP